MINEKFFMGVGLFLMDCFSWPTTPLPWDLPFIYQTHSIRKYITLAKTWCASHKDLSSFYICDNKDVFKDWFKDILIFWREKYQYSEPFSATWHPEFFGLFHLVKNLLSFTSNMKRSQVDKKRAFAFPHFPEAINPWHDPIWSKSSPSSSSSSSPPGSP